MVRSLVLFVALSLLPAVAEAASDGGCSTLEIAVGTCTVGGNIGDGEVVLDGNLTTPGTPGVPGDSGGDDFFEGDPSAVDPDDDCVRVLVDRCFGEAPGRGTDEPVEPAQPITLSDIAAFRPDPGTDHMEPNGWMIVGLDTNFYAEAGTQVHTGTLLGVPAAVRFTPVAYHWTYGDGTAATSTTKGSPWAAQGVQEFDETSTSHIYSAPGTYVITLSIDFTAEYSISGRGWTAISGRLSVPANDLIATAGDAKTVLVERECTLKPSGPGC